LLILGLAAAFLGFGSDAGRAVLEDDSCRHFVPVLSARSAASQTAHVALGQ